MHYDHNTVDGSQRKDCIQVGFINDLSMIVSDDVNHDAGNLLQLWQQIWVIIATDKPATDALITQVGGNPGSD
ncbi:MAG: hypothetical protein RQ732_00230 [Methylophaga sp.]|nr:hypothetical protein [Methylophaga sp.]